MGKLIKICGERKIREGFSFEVKVPIIYLWRDLVVSHCNLVFSTEDVNTLLTPCRLFAFLSILIITQTLYFTMTDAHILLTLFYQFS